MKNQVWKASLQLGMIALISAGAIAGVEPSGRLNQPVAAQDSNQGTDQTITGRLSADSETLGDDSYYNPHNFEAEAGQSFLIEMVSEEFDTYLILLDAEGNQIAENDDGENSTNAQIAITIPATGEYMILANSYGAGETGTYTLTIRYTTIEVVQRFEKKIEADRLNQQGIQQYRVSEFRDALASWETALQLYREIGDRRGEAYALGNLGLAYRNLDEYHMAIDYHEQSLSIAREVNDRRGEANALGNLGLSYDNLGDYSTAIDYHEQSLFIKREIGDRQGEANSLDNLGLAYRSLGDYSTAIDYHEQSLFIKREIGDRQGEAYSLGNLGNAYLNLGDYPMAIDYHEQSLSIKREIGDRQGEAASLGSLGLAYDSLGEYGTAIDYHEQSLAIDREIEDRQGEANSLDNLGLAYRSLGEHRTAIDYHEQSLSVKREIGDRQGEANALGNLGIAYDSLGEYQRAIDYYEQQLAITREIGDRQGEANALGNLGIAYDSLGEYQRAIDYYEQSLSVAREIGARQGEANALANLGVAHLNLGDSQLAIDYYEQGLALFQQIGDASGEGTALGNLGKLYQEQGDTNLAIAFLKASISVSERIRSGLQLLPQDLQQSYTDTVSDTYRTLADLLLERGEILEAQYVLELLKIEELEEYTRSRVTSIEDRTYELSQVEGEVIDAHGSLVALERDEQVCRASSDCPESEWEQMDQRIQSLEAEFEAAVDTLQIAYQATGDDEDLVMNPDQFTGTAAEIVAIPGTVLIYPVVLQDKLWILWGTSGVSNAIEFPVTQGEIGEAVLRFRQLMEVCEERACTTEDITEVQSAAQTLYSYLLPPQLEQELAALQETLPAGQVPNLVFALDRVTRYVPMAALFDGEQYLIEKYTVSTILSAETFSQNNPLRAIPSPRVLALGLSNAVPDHGFPYALTNVPAELDAIVDTLYPGLRLLNEEFTADAFRQRDVHQILHIATHGVFEPNQRDASFLMLGSGEPITIADLENYKSRFNEFSLVVLSACESALSKPDQNGLEIASIASVFIDAKVDTVIASLWQVNDISTSQLMQQFYSTLSTGDPDITISQALRTAQQHMINGEISSETISTQGRNIAVQLTEQTIPRQANYAHPYYWAPFVIIGNGL